MKVYLDNSATTKVDKGVLNKMLSYFDIDYGNAASIHRFGQDAKKGLENARKIAADILNCEKNEVFFTSGATESNNLAIKGLFYYLSKLTKYKNQKLHFITSKIEHHCVLDSLKSLEKNFDDFIEVTYLNVNSDGLINLNELKKKIKKNTVLISIMYVNNEIGTVEPISKVGKMVKKIREKRELKNELSIFFHTDAVQAFSYFNCDVKKLGVDILTLSAHKIYGPKGVGLIYKRKEVFLHPMIDGGGQEDNLRSGTSNVPGAVGLGKAMEIAQKDRRKNFESVKKVRNYLLEKLKKEIKDIKINGSLKKRSPNNLNVSFKGIEGEGIVLLLSEYGIAVSTGSACSASDLSASHVQLAIGNDHLTAHGSIRFSFSKYNTKKEIDYTVKKLKRVVEKLRKISNGVSICKQNLNHSCNN